jgi:glucosyl-3-phosphoglycerate synthase
MARTTPPLGSPDPRPLAERKAALGTSISVVLPAKDEEGTVGQIVGSVRRLLVERIPLVDEIIVMDDGSTDHTAEFAEEEGATVHQVGSVLPGVLPGTGKGNALWRSLAVTTGEIVVWIDADVRNFRPHFVTRLVEPLLEDADIGLVKAYYRRPLHDAPTGGGRVTEIMARPLLSALFPELRKIVQPLSGEYSGRRALLEAVPFVQGYGVEIGLLIDIAAEIGIDGIAQSDLGAREHRNRRLDELSAQAMAVLVTCLRRAGMPSERMSTTLTRFGVDHEPIEVEIEVREQPPMITVAEYRARFGRELSA